MFVLNKSTNRLVDTPVGFSDNRRTALPMMSWADWDLLQELHKAREKSQLCQDEGCDHHGTPHVCINSPNPDPFPSYDKQYESLARPAGGGAPSGHVGGVGGKAEMNWQAVAADLQDQIKDWETKCKQLETKCENKDQYIKELADEAGKLRDSLSVAVQLKDDALRQNAELSKSLQHYRNAYFADQGKEGNNDGQK